MLADAHGHLALRKREVRELVHCGNVNAYNAGLAVPAVRALAEVGPALGRSRYGRGKVTLGIGRILVGKGVLRLPERMRRPDA